MRFILFFALTISAGLLFSCESCKPGDRIEFSGNVVSNSGATVPGAQVKVNDQEITTDEKGNFKLSFSGKPAVDYLVTIRKFGFGLYSSRFNVPFREKKFKLSEGTILTFDPSVENTLEDTVSTRNPFQPSLLGLDTAKLFKAIPKVYDGAGNLIDLGYPEGMEHIFDYLKIPLGGGRGISVNIPANSIVDQSGNAPPSGSTLQASLSTVDFFNPDGMPGNSVVRTQEGLAFMESFGAGTIEISDGKTKYQVKKGVNVKVTFPVYPIRLNLKENLPKRMPLLHYDEEEGVWKETGVGILNETQDAYIAEVGHFSVLNMDIIKTGNSKCFKIRQMLKFGASDNSAAYLSQYRAQIIVPPTATSNFKELDYLVDEATGCVPVASGANTTTLHPITRLPDTYIAVVFSRSGLSDTLDIVFSQPASTSIPAQTAVASAMDCSTASCAPASCTSPDPHDAAASPQSVCNTSCWMPDCGFIPFSNLGPELKIVAVATGAGKVKVKWVNTNAANLGSLRVTAYTAAGCSGAGTAIFTKCGPSGCGPGECVSGEVSFTGVVSGTVSFKVQAFDNATLDCTGIPLEACSSSIVVR